MRPWLGVSLAAVLLAWQASAQTPNPEARAAFQEGVRQYGERHFAEALESFRRAYRVQPHPSVLVNIANCQIALDQPQAAITTFRRYLGEAGSTLTPERRAEIERTLEEARRRLASLVVNVPVAGAEIYLDGDLLGTAPMRAPVQTVAGQHLLEARVPGGRPIQLRVRLDGESTTTATLDPVNGRAFVGASQTVEPQNLPPIDPLPPVRPPPPSTPPDRIVVAPRLPPPRDVPTRPQRASGPPTAFWVGAAATVALAGTATAFALYARSLVGDFDATVAEFRATTDPARQMALQRRGLSIADAVDQNNTISYVATAGAVGAGIFTLGALIFWPRAPRETTTGWLLVPTVHTPGAALVTTF